MTLNIELSAELERHVAREAAQRSQTPAEFARAVLEERFARTSEATALSPEQRRDTVPDYADLPRRSPEDLEALARQQGASLAVDWAGLQPNFWPEDEPVEDFIAALREWRRDADPPGSRA